MVLTALQYIYLRNTSNIHNHYKYAKLPQSQKDARISKYKTYNQMKEKDEFDIGEKQVPSKSHPPPQWIKDYISFHNDARKKYPGKELFTNPDAPKIIIRLCLGLCGGLHDRLGQLPLDLVIANQTQRILLIQWHKPHALENYLIPNEIDWTVPNGVGYDDMKAARNHTEFPVSYSDDPTIEELDDAIQRTAHGDLSKFKVINLRILGDESSRLLSSRLYKSKEFDDMIDDSLTFGRIFWAFFKPSPSIQRLVQEHKEYLHLKNNSYIAVHCRTRHPKGWPKDKPLPRAENPMFPADRSDIVFDGYEKEHTINITTHALRCASNFIRSNRPNEPVLLSTDTFKVTNFILSDKNSPFHNSNLNLVARNDSIPSFHIDRKRGRSIEEHYGTFIDLFLTVEARCIFFGIGNFGRFAAKISGTSCVGQHRKVEWNTHIAPEWFAPACRMGDGRNESQMNTFLFHKF